MRQTASPHDLIGTLLSSLTRAGYFMATAESCTGGMIAAWCTNVPGSSAWFKGGIVSYSNEMKRDVLGVPQEALDTHGAVSGPVVKAMALGALGRCGADASVAVSGVAGPTGGSPEKPVGTVWIAVAVKETAGRCMFTEAGAALAEYGCARTVLGADTVILSALRHHFPGDRASVRYSAAEKALHTLAALLNAAKLG